MLDRVVCPSCGADLTAVHDDNQPRRPCPVCGDTRRLFEASFGGEIRPVGHLSGTVIRQGGSVTVLAPVADTVTDAVPPTIETEQEIAAYFDHLVRTYPPRQPGDSYVVLLINPDTGLVDLVVHEDRAEALRRLAEPFAEDT